MAGGGGVVQHTHFPILLQWQEEGVVTTNSLPNTLTMAGGGGSATYTSHYSYNGREGVVITYSLPNTITMAEGGGSYNILISQYFILLQWQGEG